ncbi:MAG: peptide deformylase [Chloroflexi bacterium]|nr:peptide deformylase [Chloroflexota bacterium]
MAILPIVLVEDKNPILRQKTRKINKVTPAIQEIVDHMVETMHDAPGMGLAAPQVNVPLRILIAQVPQDEEEPDAGKLFTMINPEIVKVSEEMEAADEGCLSIPGLLGEVDRHVAVEVRALNRSGKPVRIKARGLLARIFQHEIDHLDGILFTDRITAPGKLFKLVRTEDGVERVPLSGWQEPAKSSH